MTPENEDWATPSLKEAEFWRDGMTVEEYEEERDYLWSHYDLLLEAKYMPLWKQRELGLIK